MNTAQIVVGIVGGILSLIGFVLGLLSIDPRQPLPPEVMDLPIYDWRKFSEIGSRSDRGCFWGCAVLVVGATVLIEVVIWII